MAVLTWHGSGKMQPRSSPRISKVYNAWGQVLSHYCHGYGRSKNVSNENAWALTHLRCHYFCPKDLLTLIIASMTSDRRTEGQMDRRTDGTENITSTADAGGKNVLSSKWWNVSVGGKVSRWLGLDFLELYLVFRPPIYRHYVYLVTSVHWGLYWCQYKLQYTGVTKYT